MGRKDLVAMKARVSDKGSSTGNEKDRLAESEGEGATELSAEWSADPPEDIGEEELRDFLAADYLEVRADPSFREGLRRRLWSIVSNRYGRSTRDD